MKKHLVLFVGFFLTFFLFYPTSVFAFGECTTSIENNLYSGQCGICLIDTVDGGQGSCYSIIGIPAGGHCCVNKSAIRNSSAPPPVQQPQCEYEEKFEQYQCIDGKRCFKDYYKSPIHTKCEWRQYNIHCDNDTSCGNNGGNPGGNNNYSCENDENDTGTDPCPSAHGAGSRCSRANIAYGDGCTEETTSSGSTPVPARGSGNGGGGGGGYTPPTCTAPENNCTFSSEDGACYGGHTDNEKGVNKFNVDCEGTCNSQAVDCPKEDKKPKDSDKKYIDCNPGEPVDECSVKCKKGGTCESAHTYCEWTEDGNVESKCVCDDETVFCSDDSKESSSSCKDNPVSPPDGYTWKNSCDKKCDSNDQCPQNTNDSAVNPDTSNWCYDGACLMLVTKSGGSSSDKSGSRSSGDEKKADDKKKADKKKADKKKADKKKQDKAKKDSKNTPTPTPGPNTPTAAPTPTPLPPLAEPGNWQGFCGPTTNAQKPLGIRVSWDAVSGATRYAVRIDEDAPSWEGDTPSPGDTVDNQVTGTAYVRQAKPGAVYQWWVHSVNASGVYSALTKKVIVKCPESTTTTASGSANTVGAGQLIVLP